LLVLFVSNNKKNKKNSQVPQNPVHGAELLKGIRHLATGDTWWEVRVQVVVLAATLLTCLPADDDKHVRVPLDILVRGVDRRGTWHRHGTVMAPSWHRLLY
jgi:hypothetical protein